MSVTALGAFLAKMDPIGLRAFVLARTHAVTISRAARGWLENELARGGYDLKNELRNELFRGLFVELAVTENDRKFEPSQVYKTKSFFGTESVVALPDRSIVNFADGVAPLNVKAFTIILFIYRCKWQRSLSGEYGVIPLPAPAHVPGRIWNTIGEQFGNC